MDTPIIAALTEWLKDELEEAGDAEEAPLFDDAYSSADIDEENLPDWLADVAVDDEPFEPSEPSPLDIDETDEENLPDWLLDVQQQAVTAELTVAGVAAGQTDLPDIIEEDELPAWLQEEAAEAPLEFTREPVPVAEMVEPEPGLAQAIEAEPEPEVPPVPVAVVAAPVVAPPEPKPEAPAPAVPASRPTGMPDWLKKLREGDTEFAETAAVATPLPGPLAPPKRAARVQMFAPEPDSLAEPSFEDLPEDPAERLKLAQSCREQGDVDLAVRAYESLVSGGYHLDKVIDDLQQLIKTRPADFRLYQVLGDGLMKDGRLQNALEAYRAALGKLAAG
jgi:tetratricopeptide (TPR) repeat protein